MTPQDLGNVIWGLCGHLPSAGPFHRLPPSTQQALTQALCRPGVVLQRKTLAAMLTGLSRRTQPSSSSSFSSSPSKTSTQRSAWQRLPPALRTKLLRSLGRLTLAPQLQQSQQQASDTSPSPSPSSIPNALRSVIFTGNVLYALGRLEVSWTDAAFDPASTAGIDTDINRESESDGDCRKALLMSLVLGSGAGLAVENRFARSGNLTGTSSSDSSRSTSRAVSFALNGLARMGFWAEHGPNSASTLSRTTLTHSFNSDSDSDKTSEKNRERHLLLLAVTASVPHMSSREVANTLWSLGHMSVPMHLALGPASVSRRDTDPVLDTTSTTGDAAVTAGSVLLTALTRTAADMAPFEFAWSLWALARCFCGAGTGAGLEQGLSLQKSTTQGQEQGAVTAAYELLPLQLRSLLVATACQKVPGMAPRELGVALWAFGRLKVPVAALPPSLIDSLFAGIEMLAKNTRRA